MKRLLIAGVFIAVLAMAMSVQGAYTSSQRDTVTVTDGYLYYTVHIAGATNYNNNTTLPVAIGNLNHTQTRITWHWTGAVRMLDGYWNQRGYPDYNYTTGSVTEALWVAETNGLKYTSTYSHINFSMNNTNWYADVYYVYDNITGINAAITTTEEDVNDPNVGKFWTVNDTLEFTTPPLPTGVVAYLKLSYPSGPGTPDIYPWNGTAVINGTELYVTYQKNGPAHDLATSDVTGGTNSVTAEFTSDDKLKDAIWNIDITDEAWDGKFAGITSPVTVTVNDDVLDATDVDLTGNTIALTGLSIPKDDNTVVFTWTAPSGGGGTTPGPTTTPVGPGLNWNTEVANGVPAWAAVAIGIVVIFTIIAVASIEKK